ncbi:MAG TPA: Maf family protein [Candidatus Saccharimonadales bacterium]|nr:Maf family protein [Candidatus Saccharimonadales bacterium]
MRKIILASQSPRRKELLTMMGLEFEAVPSDFDEQLDDTRTPEAVAMELGLGKAMAVAQRYPEAIVIGSDTIVTIDGRQLAKAATIDEARAMLRDVTLHPNTVTSSLAVVCLAENKQSVQAESSRVYFKPYDAKQIDAYLATGDYADKAGAYGVQSGAAALIDHIEGNVDTIVGLPTHLLAPVLRQFGYQVTAIEYRLASSVRVVPIP